MAVTVRHLAEMVHGSVLGDANLLIQSARTLPSAGPGDISFVESDVYLAQLSQSRASAAVVMPHLPLNGKALIQVPDPLMAFAAIVQHLHGKPAAAVLGIDPRAIVHPSVQIGAESSAPAPA